MDVDQVVLLGRMTLQEVVILAGPILAIAIVVWLGGEHRAGAHVAAGHDRLHRRAIDGYRAAHCFCSCPGCGGILPHLRFQRLLIFTCT